MLLAKDPARPLALICAWPAARAQAGEHLLTARALATRRFNLLVKKAIRMAKGTDNKND